MKRFQRNMFSLLVLVLLCVPAARSADQPAPQEIEAAANNAINKGLAYLALQQRGDGSFEARGTKIISTGLSLMAFLSAGRTAEGGEYGGVVRRSIEFLLRQTPGDRYFGRVDGSKLYGQAVVTLALCEAYGVEPDEQTRARILATLKDAVNVLIGAQNVSKNAEQRGGWSEDRGGAKSDPVVTQWAMAALRAAGKIGLNVPKETMGRAERYVTQLKGTGDHSAKADSHVMDAEYFDALKGIENDTDEKLDQLIARQKVDGGWAPDATEESSETVSAASLAELRLTAKLRLTPADD